MATADAHTAHRAGIFVVEAVREPDVAVVCVCGVAYVIANPARTDPGLRPSVAGNLLVLG